MSRTVSMLGYCWLATLFLGCLMPTCLLFAQAPESTADAKNAYADVANSQNAGAFDIAVEDWQKFLKPANNVPVADGRSERA